MALRVLLALFVLAVPLSGEARGPFLLTWPRVLLLANKQPEASKICKARVLPPCISRLAFYNLRLQCFRCVAELEDSLSVGDPEESILHAHFSTVS